MSVIPSKESQSQKGCHKSVALVAKDKNRQEAESTALSCPPSSTSTEKLAPHPGPLLRLHSCSTVFDHPYSPAYNSPAALWNVAQGKPLNFPSTSL